MKKLFSVAIVLLVASAMLFANGQSEASSSSKAAIRVGMVTDAGSVDDRGFNQGTWEGVQAAAADFGLGTATYLRPTGTTTSEFVTSISSLVDDGYTFIACPGYMLSEAVAEAQEMYPEINIVILDDALASGIGENTVAITFKEQESAFLAGIATALKIQSGDVGFVGGMEIPSVQAFSWGFQQGIKYANENLGTSVNMDPSNFVYSGSFSDLALGQQLANTMYAKGVKAVFAAAGGTGVGSINEAKNRRLSGQDVWVIGVDTDQYSQGDMGNGQSAVLTSAMKDVKGSVYDMISALVKNDGSYPGGQHLVFGINEGRVGIPETNPNLTPEIESKVAEVAELVRNGQIVVAASSEGLIP